jgi:Zn-dependent protease
MISGVSLGGIDLSVLLMTAAVLFFSLSIHEPAHAWPAYWLGDPTGRSLGRFTLNPLAHIDPVGTVVFPFLGLFFVGFIFEWPSRCPSTPLAWEIPEGITF